MSKSRNNLLSLLLALCMLFSAAPPAFADLSVPTSDEVSEHEIRSAAISLQLATEAVVLLENDGTLPIAKENTKIALFGPARFRRLKAEPAPARSTTESFIRTERKKTACRLASAF